MNSMLHHRHPRRKLGGFCQIVLQKRHQLITEYRMTVVRVRVILLCRCTTMLLMVMWLLVGRSSLYRRCVSIPGLLHITVQTRHA